MPLYPGTPTDWSNLYTAFKIAQNVTVEVTGSKTTIISLDLQLYAKAMQLREKVEIKQNFVFILGELHIVFAMLKCIGKYIEGSGLDSLFLETGIYGECTLSQIIGGKRMKMAMEAHTTMYLALYHGYLNAASNEHPEIVDMLDRIRTANLFFEGVEYKRRKDRCKNHREEIRKVMNEEGLSEKLQIFFKSLDHQDRFLRNYMDMFESLLLFVRSSRQGLWELHLSSLDGLIKYFFAHDHLNYARMTPLYRATMLELKSNDLETWQYLKENFAIAKSEIPFTAIGSDHAMEQENKVLKVSGGVTGLTQNESALNRFCLASPVLASLYEDFCKRQNIKTEYRKCHYQLLGSTQSRIAQNTNTLIKTMREFNIGFGDADFVFNVFSKAVPPSQSATELLNHENIGSECYKRFINERFHGSTSVWAQLKKTKLKTFKSANKRIMKKVDNKVIELREEKTLLSRFLITARKRPELDLEHCLGNYEFSVVPKSLFSTDGQPLTCTDQSSLLHHIEDLTLQTQQENSTNINNNTHRVIIIDDMAVVNEVKKTKDIQSCKVGSLQKVI